MNTTRIALQAELKSAAIKVMDLAKYQNECENLSFILTQLKNIVDREDKRHMMDQHLTPSMLSLLDEEIIPMLENELDYDPTPEHLYDHSGGEPPVTMAEIHAHAWGQHQESHR